MDSYIKLLVALRRVRTVYLKQTCVKEIEDYYHNMFEKNNCLLTGIILGVKTISNFGRKLR
jgi:hypothetical protein